MSFAWKATGRRAPPARPVVAYQMDFNCQVRRRSRRIVWQRLWRDDLSAEAALQTIAQNGGL
jgi:hypothetical protein